MIYYVNSEGVRVNLYEPPFVVQNGHNLFDYTWSYNSQALGIENMYRSVQTKKFKISVLPSFDFTEDRKGKFITAINYLHDIFETDIRTNKKGKLYCNDYYLPCFIYKSTKKSFEQRDDFTFAEFDVVFESGWIKELQFDKSLNNSSSKGDGTKVYPYQYSYRYGNNPLYDKFFIDGSGEYDFKLIVYGPVENPSINIGGNIYQVNCYVKEDEYLTILSTEKNTEKKIYITDKNGVQINQFNNRNKENDVFKKISSGNNDVILGGYFDFTLIVYRERSEPEWK